MLHQSLAAGQNLGYTNEGTIVHVFPESVQGGIIPPQPPGYTPAPGNPLIPIYQWRVVQSGRTYYYYSGPSFSGGPGYYFEGQLGWVLPANYDGSARDQNGRQILGAPVAYYYSTSKGYWYTTQEPNPLLGICYPDGCNTTYSFQGVGFQLPTWDPGAFQNPPSFTFLPPPPPPSCDPVDEQACYNFGGSWDASTCSCNFFDPCGGGVCAPVEAQTDEEPPPTPGN
ncbi:MAG TPA: hypothetical protein VER32_01505 [Pyrinomonadaceae bacterium]|nr:hypothetical protein [Pyrinomonadaceae bacterium]